MAVKNGALVCALIMTVASILIIVTAASDYTGFATVPILFLEVTAGMRGFSLCILGICENADFGCPESGGSDDDIRTELCNVNSMGVVAKILTSCAAALVSCATLILWLQVFSKARYTTPGCFSCSCREPSTIVFWFSLLGGLMSAFGTLLFTIFLQELDGITIDGLESLGALEMDLSYAVFLGIAGGLFSIPIAVVIGNGKMCWKDAPRNVNRITAQGAVVNGNMQ